jgi:hypothetical protein
MPNIFEQEIASVKDRVDYLDITLTNAINAINSINTLTVQAFSRLNELEQVIQLLKEELYGPDQDKVKTEFEEEFQEDYHIEDDFLDIDEEQDDEG